MEVSRHELHRRLEIVIMNFKFTRPRETTMAIDLGINFPTETQVLKQHLTSEKKMTVSERLMAADDLSSTAIRLSQSGGMYEKALKRHAELEDEWRRCMLEFIAKHVVTD